MNPESLQQCTNISAELDEMHKMEKSYWYTQARADEMKDGDTNTK